MTTTTDKPKAPRTKRTTVPAVDVDPASTTSVVDALAATPPTADVRPVALAALDPHPSNPRRDLGDLSELTDSIRVHGVRQNILVVPNPDPDSPVLYRIVIGHRRAAAAALAGLDTIPAAVDDTLSDADQLELMLLENLQRADLTAVEEADGYQGLLDLGVDVAAIAARTGRSGTTVRSRLRLLQLPEAAREKVHTHQATLDDALQLLEFTDLPDVLADLTDRLGDRDFVHHAQRAKDDLAAALDRAVLLADLQAQGVTVVDRPTGDVPSKATRLDELAAKPSRPGQYAKAIAVDEHATCPGHVAWIQTAYNGPVAVYACTDPMNNGHYSRYGSAASGKPDAGTPEARAARRELIDSNKAAAAAEKVRRAWIHDLLQRAKMPDDAALYAARIIRPGTSADYREKAVYTDLLYGKDVTDRDADADLTSAARGLRHLVALAAARVEASVPKDYWRLSYHDHQVHLAQLAAWGYPLADVEQAYLAKHAPKGGASS